MTKVRTTLAACAAGIAIGLPAVSLAGWGDLLGDVMEKLPEITDSLGGKQQPTVQQPQAPTNPIARQIYDAVEVAAKQLALNFGISQQEIDTQFARVNGGKPMPLGDALTRLEGSEEVMASVQEDAERLAFRADRAVSLSRMVSNGGKGVLDAYGQALAGLGNGRIAQAASQFSRQRASLHAEIRKIGDRLKNPEMGGNTAALAVDEATAKSFERKTQTLENAIRRASADELKMLASISAVTTGSLEGYISHVSGAQKNLEAAGRALDEQGEKTDQIVRDTVFKTIIDLLVLKLALEYTNDFTSLLLKAYTATKVVSGVVTSGDSLYAYNQSWEALQAAVEQSNIHLQSARASFDRAAEASRRLMALVIAAANERGSHDRIHGRSS